MDCLGYCISTVCFYEFLKNQQQTNKQKPYENKINYCKLFNCTVALLNITIAQKQTIW